MKTEPADEISVILEAESFDSEVLVDDGVDISDEVSSGTACSPG